MTLLAIVDRALDGVILLGGAGLLAAVIQLTAASRAVRSSILRMPTNLLFIHKDARSARREIRSIFRMVIDGETVAPAAFLSAISVARPNDPWSEIAAFASNAAQRAHRMSGALLLDRVLYPSDVHALQGYLRSVMSEADLLAQYRKVGPSHADDVSFASFVTALTGAIVLADASDTSARVFEHVSVLHRGEPEYAHEQTCTWQHLLGSGDYDGPVLDVRSVTRVRHPRSSRFGVVLETTNSCYAATEAGGESTGCKHLQPTVGPIRSTDHNYWLRDSTWLKLPSTARTTLLTAYVIIRTSDDKLVLAQRSRRTRNGLNVLSLTAGGVVEYAAGFGDANDAGSPDLARAVTRETREEIGVDLTGSALRPVCVFLANSVGPSRAGEIEGQIVASVAYAVSVDQSYDDVVRSMATRSDPATGAFEVSSLESVVIGDSPSSLAGWIAENAVRLDQHAVVGLAYALVLRFGLDASTLALREAFPDRPWWLVTDGAWPTRTCVEPGALCGATTNSLLASAHPPWVDAYPPGRPD